MLTRALRRVRSPRGSITPERGPDKGIGGKGKGAAMEPADDPRQRDHTTGGDEGPSDQEVADHNEHKERYSTKGRTHM